jgi:ABC-type amino acid transport substrate-binding protein
MKKSLLLIAAMGLLSTSVLAKEIKFATEATYAPFEYLDDKNEFQGFDIDLAPRLRAGQAGVQLPQPGLRQPDPQPQVPSL